MEGPPLLAVHRLAGEPLTPWPMADEVVLEGDPSLRGCAVPVDQDGRNMAGIWEASPARIYGVSRDRWVKFVLSGRMAVYPSDGEPYELGEGDVLVLNPGCAVEEHILEPVRLLFQRKRELERHLDSPEELADRATRGPHKATASSSGKALRRRSHRGEGRRALLEATIRLIARYGSEGVTYRSVAAEAGVQNGLVSYYFLSRDHLIHEALGLALETNARRAQTGDLRSLVENGSAEGVLRFRYALNGRLHPELRSDVRDLYDTYVERAVEALGAAGIDADTALARLLLATLDGLVIQELVLGKETAEATLARLESVIDRLASAMRPGPSPPR